MIPWSGSKDLQRPMAMPPGKPQATLIWKFFGAQKMALGACAIPWWIRKEVTNTLLVRYWFHPRISGHNESQYGSSALPWITLLDIKKQKIAKICSVSAPFRPYLCISPKNLLIRIRYQWIFWKSLDTWWILDTRPPPPKRNKLVGWLVHIASDSKHWSTEVSK